MISLGTLRSVIEYGLPLPFIIAIYRVGLKSKLLIFSEYVDKTENTRGT